MTREEYGQAVIHETFRRLGANAKPLLPPEPEPPPKEEKPDDYHELLGYIGGIWTGP